MAKNAPKGNVIWRFPDKKKPFAYTPSFVALQCNLLGDEANSRKPSIILKHIEDNHYVGLYELKQSYKPILTKVTEMCLVRLFKHISNLKLLRLNERRNAK